MTEVENQLGGLLNTMNAYKLTFSVEGSNVKKWKGQSNYHN